MHPTKKLAFAAGLLLALAAATSCRGTPAPTLAPTKPLPTLASTPGLTPVLGSDLTGILWQWESFKDTAGENDVVVDNPDDYTLVFQPGGIVDIQADCNRVGGAFSLQGASLTLTPGPSTMAFCGEDSMDAQYLGWLGEVRTYVTHEGKLVLNLMADAGNMIFADGGPAAQRRAPAAAPQTPAGVAIDPESVSLDLQGLPYSWQANLVPITPYDDSQPPGPVGLPEHIQINFGTDAQAPPGPGDKQPGDPVIYIIPLHDYWQLWEASGDLSTTIMLELLHEWLLAQPEPIPTGGMPVLPFEELAGTNDLAVQGRYLGSSTLSGVRFVGRFVPDANPVTNHGLRYVFQGFSEDDAYFIAFFYPVSTSALPQVEEVSAKEQERVDTDLEDYMEERAGMLNDLAPEDWDPDLSVLDSVLESLEFQTSEQ